MNKTFIIIKREYLTRVRKKTFIISTLLFPLLYVGLIFGMGYLAENSKQVLNIALVDQSGYFGQAVLDEENTIDPSSKLSLISEKAADVFRDPESAGFDGFIRIPALDWQRGNDSMWLESKKSYGSGTTAAVQAKLNRIWSRIKNDSLSIDESKQAILQGSQLSIRPRNLEDDTANANLAEVIGYIAGLLIYMILLIYGSQVMMGVMEEKTNRIAEVLVSSVRPFQMMMGKILGIGLVALTQFLLWIGFVFLIYNITMATGNGLGSASAMVGAMQNVITGINVPLILFCFGFYFLGGFFFYSSLYAAIGSAVNEDLREAQSLSFPITMLVIISIALMTTAIANPTGPIAVWASLIPFSSPIVMMARIPYGVPGTVPWWQLGLSMLLLILGFLATVWFAAKIYRTGILMYGKKPSWGEMLKWVFRKS
ncbi:MAG: ABC transporter permease [Bacteroidetes bacterium]|nr:ABC transporter permease [Bacteroidota bacterium]